MGSAEFIWTEEKPTTPGVYLYRVNETVGLMKVEVYKDIQRGIREGLYASCASPFAISTSVKSVANMNGEWCDVTEFCRAGGN